MSGSTSSPYTHMYTLGLPLISSPSLPNWVSPPETSFSANSLLFIPQSKAEQHLLLLPGLICFSPLDVPLSPPSQLGWRELQQQESLLFALCKPRLISFYRDSWLQVPGSLLQTTPWQRAARLSQRIKASCWDSAFHLWW